MRRMHGVGKQAEEEDVPILFDDDDGADALAYKQEETVVTMETESEQLEAAPDDMQVVEQLEAT